MWVAFQASYAIFFTLETILDARRITGRERDGACVGIGVMEPRRGLEVNVSRSFRRRGQCPATITGGSAF
jgi:hypothetical protein